MKLREFKQRYESQKAEAEGNLMAAEAEVKRLTAVAHHFGGAIAAINDLEQDEADELKRKLESREKLSEEDIQHALQSCPETVFKDGATPEAEAVSGAVPTCELPQKKEEPLPRSPEDPFTGADPESKAESIVKRCLSGDCRGCMYRPISQDQCVLKGSSVPEARLSKKDIQRALHNNQVELESDPPPAPSEVKALITEQGGSKGLAEK